MAALFISNKGEDMRTFSLDEVIDSMIKSGRSPAYKAHATRRLKSYVTKRSIEIGAKPSQVVAAVKAAVTKRLQK